MINFYSLKIFQKFEISFWIFQTSEVFNRRKFPGQIFFSQVKFWQTFSEGSSRIFCRCPNLIRVNKLIQKIFGKAWFNTHPFPDFCKFLLLKNPFVIHFELLLFLNLPFAQPSYKYFLRYGSSKLFENFSQGKCLQLAQLMSQLASFMSIRVKQRLNWEDFQSFPRCIDHLIPFKLSNLSKVSFLKLKTSSFYWKKYLLNFWQNSGKYHHLEIGKGFLCWFVPSSRSYHIEYQLSRRWKSEAFNKKPATLSTYEDKMEIKSCERSFWHWKKLKARRWWDVPAPLRRRDI